MQTQTTMIKEIHAYLNNTILTEQNSENAELIQKLVELELELRRAENAVVGYKIELTNARKNEAELLKRVSKLHSMLEKKTQQLTGLPI